MKATAKEVENTATHLVGALKPKVERTAERVVEATEAMANAVGSGIDALASRRQVALDGMRETITASPVRAIGITLAAGIVLGFLMRRR